MSKPAPKESKGRTLRFIIVLCAICALILSLLATSLQSKQKQAVELNRLKELLVAAKILSPDQDTFYLADDQDEFQPAKFDPEQKMLIPTTSLNRPSAEEIFLLAEARVVPLLVDDKGNSFTFEEAKVDYQKYLEENEKSGYAKLPLKLVYKILQNYPSSESRANVQVQSYVLPINGFGLWDAIYGYIALEPNGDSVIGTTWYEQKETPGLGAEISTPSWQKQFYGKLIFQKNADGSTNLERGPIGIIVVKGSVQEVYGSSPKAESAVDGLTGATETGKGVTNAYRDSLTPYRQFLIRLHEGKS